MDDYAVDPLPPRSSRYRSAEQSQSKSRSSSICSSVESYSTHSGQRKGTNLLERRVLSVEQYARELRQGAAAAKEELVAQFGAGPVPIPVPLAAGESEAVHERRFLGWIAKKGLTLAKLQQENPNKERTLRLFFAKLKVKDIIPGEDAPSTASKRARGFEAANDEDDYHKRPRQDAMSGVAAARRLLRERVLSVTAYRDEVARENSSRRLTDDERLALYGTTTVPIPVPLFPGENADQYERRFQKYLTTISMDTTRLASEPNTERTLRLSFARQRLKGEIRPARNSTPSITTATKKNDYNYNDGDQHSHSTREELHSSAHSTNVQSSLVFPMSCSLERSSSENDTPSTSLAALLQCGCRTCLLQCTSRLVNQVDDLRADLAAARAEAATVASTNTNEDTSPLMDLTRDADMSVSSGARRVDVAKMLHITSLIRSRRQQEQSTDSHHSRSDRVDDPIELQLQNQYDELNDRVITNQQALDQAAAQLQHTPLDRVQDAAPSQYENQELRSLIEEEMGHRNAALAMLVVYMWRTTPHELEQRIQANGVGNIGHVQRSCHQKCATLTSEFARLKALAVDLTQSLDAVLNEPSPTVYDADSDLQRLTRLQELGAELTRVESEVQTLVASRRRELMTILHFDAHVRELVTAFLRET